MIRKAAIVGLIIVAALLPVIALPLAIVRVDSVLIVVAAAVVVTSCDAQPAALVALTPFRAPPSL